MKVSNWLWMNHEEYDDTTRIWLLLFLRTALLLNREPNSTRAECFPLLYLGKILPTLYMPLKNITITFNMCVIRIAKLISERVVYYYKK